MEFNAKVMKVVRLLTSPAMVIRVLMTIKAIHPGASLSIWSTPAQGPSFVSFGPLVVILSKTVGFSDIFFDRFCKVEFSVVAFIKIYR